MRWYPAAGQDERATPPTTNPTKEEDTAADVGIVNTFRARVKKHSYCAYLNFGIEILKVMLQIKHSFIKGSTNCCCLPAQ